MRRDQSFQGCASADYNPDGDLETVIGVLTVKRVFQEKTIVVAFTSPKNFVNLPILPKVVITVKELAFALKKA